MFLIANQNAKFLKIRDTAILSPYSWVDSLDEAFKFSNEKVAISYKNFLERHHSYSGLEVIPE